MYQNNNLKLLISYENLPVMKHDPPFVNLPLCKIVQPAVVHYNRGMSRPRAVSKQLAKMLKTLEPHGIF